MKKHLLQIKTGHNVQAMNGVKEHWSEALQYFPQDQLVGIFLQGSQNYGLEIESSDVDTKLIVVPSFKDIALNKRPVSTTHVRANNEHTDWKDVRLYMDTFRKQNLNFLEILFTSYAVLNADYAYQWYRLVDKREAIARMNPWRAVKSMKGVALEKYHAMEHEYPSKVDVLAQYGYDPKQLHHLLRVQEYMQRYIMGAPYRVCLRPKNPDYLKQVKQGLYTLEEAREVAKQSIDKTVALADQFCSCMADQEDEKIRELLEDVQYEIMKIAVQKELEK